MDTQENQSLFYGEVSWTERISVRSVERFCSNKGIHKTSRIDEQSLDGAVLNATSMVRRIYKLLMTNKCIYTSYSYWQSAPL